MSDYVATDDDARLARREARMERHARKLAAFREHLAVQTPAVAPSRGVTPSPSCGCYVAGGVVMFAHVQCAEGWCLAHHPLDEHRCAHTMQSPPQGQAGGGGRRPRGGGARRDANDDEHA